MLTIKALKCLKSQLSIIEALEDDLEEDKERINIGDIVDKVVEVDASRGG